MSITPLHQQTTVSGVSGGQTCTDTVDDTKFGAGLSLSAIDAVRQQANARLEAKRKAALGQFMTPSSVAQYMASLFGLVAAPVRLLDAGAGVGSLSVAFLRRFGDAKTHVTAYEIDPVLREYLEATLNSFTADDFDYDLIGRDFIQDSVFQLKVGTGSKGFTHAILNPPYKKISNASAHRELLSRAGLETVNLYTAFVGLAIALLEKGGELVAIIPRSFCNGLYYKPFRSWMLSRAAIEHIHLFESRTSAFAEDAVLQENVIIKLVRGASQGAVTVSTSSDTTFGDLQSHRHEFSSIVQSDDPQQFIHIPTHAAADNVTPIAMAAFSLADLGLSVSTGPVVDFRLKEHLRNDPVEGSVPLLYPVHFSGGALAWPKDSRKPNALDDNHNTRKWMYPNGTYTIVRRFSSKEEARRIVANVVAQDAFTSPWLAFENHLNVFHSARAGLETDLAFGLCAYLNCTAVDEYFRRFSGHTQVNATDLRLLRYPSRQQLTTLGEWYRTTVSREQEILDSYIENLHAVA
jgi:adenine-specific DNA-methyltransferase